MFCVLGLYLLINGKEKKMSESNWQSVSDGAKFLKFSDFEKGETLLEGQWLGHSTNRYGEISEFLIEKQEQNDERVAIKLTALLKYRFQSLTVGDTVKIVYGGMEKLPASHKFSGKPVHRFEVYKLSESKPATKSKPTPQPVESTKPPQVQPDLPDLPAVSKPAADELDELFL